MMLDTFKLYSLIPAWMTFMFTQSEGFLLFKEYGLVMNECVIMQKCCKCGDLWSADSAQNIWPYSLHTRGGAILAIQSVL